MAEVGRPLKFKSVEELQSKIDAYFDMCNSTVIKRIVNKNGDLVSEIYKPYTITGLAAYLDTSRETLVNYEARDEYFDTIKKAKAKIQADYEERALTGENSAVMSIFTLKNNFNWRDKTEVENSGDMQVNIKVIDDKHGFTIRDQELPSSTNNLQLPDKT